MIINISITKYLNSFPLLVKKTTGEAERIKRHKGRVFPLPNEPSVHRVWLPNKTTPGLAMARTFGDYCLKDYGVISEPEVTYRRLSLKDEFVVLASDGVCLNHLFHFFLFHRFHRIVNIKEILNTWYR